MTEYLIDNKCNKHLLWNLYFFLIPKEHIVALSAMLIGVLNPWQIRIVQRVNARIVWQDFCFSVFGWSRSMGHIVRWECSTFAIHSIQTREGKKEQIVQIFTQCWLVWIKKKVWKMMMKKENGLSIALDFPNGWDAGKFVHFLSIWIE